MCIAPDSQAVVGWANPRGSRSLGIALSGRPDVGWEIRYGVE